MLSCAGALHRCCLLALVPLRANPQQWPSSGGTVEPQHPHPAALSSPCTSPPDCWVPLLLSTAWCCARNLVLSSAQFFKTIICLRTIQQEICKVDSVLSLTCSSFSQVLAVAAPDLGAFCWVQLQHLLLEYPSRFLAAAEAGCAQGSLPSVLSLTLLLFMG